MAIAIVDNYSYYYFGIANACIIILEFIERTTKLLRKKNIIYLLLLFCFVSKTQPFNQTILTVNNGLPGNFIRCSFQDSRGFLWCGSNGGLSRFDGKNFINYGLIDGLPSNEVTHIAEDDTGNLWIGTRNGLCQFDGAKFITYPIPQIIGRTFFSQLEFSTEKIIRFAVNNKAFEVRAGKILPTLCPANYPLKIRSLIVLPTKDILVTDHSKQSFLFKNGQAQMPIRFDGLPFYKNNRLFICSNTHLYEVKDNKQVALTQLPQMPTGDSVLGFVVDDKNNAWISIEELGIVTFNYAKKTFYKGDELPKSFISNVFQDKQGIVWISASTGLVKLTSSYITDVTEQTGTHEKFSLGVFKTRSNHIYFSTKTFVHQLTSNSVQTLPTKVHTLLSNTNRLYGVTGLAEDEFQTLWMVTYEGHIYQYKNNIFYNISDKIKLGIFGVLDICYAPKEKAILIPQNGFILKINNNKIDTLKNLINNASIGFITKMKVATDSSVWMLNRNNLLWYNNGQFMNIVPQLQIGTVDLSDIFLYQMKFG